MRLTPTDLLNYCKIAGEKSHWQFEITAVKDTYWYWNLELLNIRTNVKHNLTYWLSLRESKDFLRAFYQWLEFSNLLAW